MIAIRLTRLLLVLLVPLLVLMPRPSGPASAQGAHRAALRVRVPRAAAAPAPPAGTALAAVLATQLSSLTKQGQFSGVALVAQHGTVLLSKGYGLANIAHGVPNNAHSRFPVYGINATFIATAILLLQDRGKLSVQDHLCRYIANCPAAWRPITLQELLTYTAGLPGTFGLPRALAPGAPAGTAQTTLAACRSLAVVAVPGSKRVESDCDTFLAATVVEKVSGLAYGAFLQRYLFGPLGMRDSGRLTTAQRPPHLAQGYAGGQAGAQVDYGSYYFVYSSMRDVYAYDRALLDGKLLTPSSVATLFHPWIAYADGTFPARPAHQAYIWRLATTADGSSVIYGIGGGGGYSILNLLYPKEGLIEVLLSNDNADLPGIVNRSSVTTPAAPLPHPALAPDKTTLYRDAAFGLSVQLPAAWTSGMYATSDVQCPDAVTIAPETRVFFASPDETPAAYTAAFQFTVGHGRHTMAEVQRINVACLEASPLVPGSEHTGSRVINGVTYATVSARAQQGSAGYADQVGLATVYHNTSYLLLTSVMVSQPGTARGLAQVQRILASLRLQGAPLAQSTPAPDKTTLYGDPSFGISVQLPADWTSSIAATSDVICPDAVILSPDTHVFVSPDDQIGAGGSYVFSITVGHGKHTAAEMAKINAAFVSGNPLIPGTLHRGVQVIDGITYQTLEAQGRVNGGDMDLVGLVTVHNNTSYLFTHGVMLHQTGTARGFAQMQRIMASLRLQ